MIAAVFALGAMIILATAARVPTINVEPACRAFAERVAPIADLETCIRRESAAREQLVRKWQQFAAEDKSHCLSLSSTGGKPTYTELLTCLELQRDARNLRQKERATTGQGR